MTEEIQNLCSVSSVRPKKIAAIYNAIISKTEKFCFSGEMNAKRTNLSNRKKPL